MQVRAAAAEVDPHRQRATLVMLAMMAHGCAEAFAKRLHIFMPAVLNGCTSAHPRVREAACLAIGLFAQFLQPEILSHHEQVLPHLFTVRNRRDRPRQRRPRHAGSRAVMRTHLVLIFSLSC